MNTNGKTYRYFLRVTIVPMVVAVILGIVVWQCRITGLEDRQRKEVSEIIHNVVQEQAKKNLLLPQIVFINADSSKKKELNDKLIEKISAVLIKKYLADDTTKFNDIELNPFFVLPTKPNKNGNYILTEAQLNELKNHLYFLTKQVDIEMDKAKEEIGRDINRLNFWITIWIGVIGFLGIFIPVIINIDVAKNIEKADRKADIAFKRAKDALAKIHTAERNFVEATRISNEAKNKADETEKLLRAIDASSTIQNIDMSALQRVPQPMQVLQLSLNTLHLNLSTCRDLFENSIIKNLLHQVTQRLMTLTLFPFIGGENTRLIVQFTGIVSDKLNNNYNQNSFDTILSELKNLTDNLKND